MKTKAAQSIDKLLAKLQGLHAWERTKEFMRADPDEARFTMLILYWSGTIGMYQWPPSGMDAYSTLIRWTRISGPEGGLVRIIISCVMILAWTSHWVWFRKIAYVIGSMCCLLITISFSDAGQGFATGVWLVGTMCGLRAVYAEGGANAPVLDDDTAFDADAAAKAAVERAFTRSKQYDYSSRLDGLASSARTGAGHAGYVGQGSAP